MILFPGMQATTSCLMVNLMVWDSVLSPVLTAKDQNISAWLTALPLARNQFDLSAQDFRDGLVLRYNKPLIQVPNHLMVVVVILVLSMPSTVDSVG